tara:strand:+ start:673 stop:1026 length:354 start_codon:yes stop_codon:yes gene_type:complete
MRRIKNKSRQYLFKNKFKKRHKSKKELLKESSLMMMLGLFLLLINYFIPQKIRLFSSFKENIFYIFNNLLEILLSFLEILIVLLISFSVLLSIFFIVGSINRIIKVMLYKSRKISSR